MKRSGERWWDKPNGRPEGPVEKQKHTDENHVGDIGQGWRDGLGILGTTIADTGIYTFGLTSIASARNFRLYNDPEVEVDILVMFLISTLVACVIAYYMRSKLAFGWGIALAVIFSLIYLIRGGFIKLPWHIPLLTPKLAGTD